MPEKYTAPYASLPEPRRTYAGMLAAMDEAIGQILGALDARGLRTNTLIFFSSDNGGPSPGRVTSNGPLRAGKGTVYEGGTRVCACVAWPGHIKPGSVVKEPLHMVDWYPTLLKLAGASVQQKLPLDGRDIWPVLTQGKASPHDEILLNTTPRGGAIRVGDWKLVINGATGTGEQDEETPAPAKRKKAARKNQPPELELFNLAQDLSEEPQPAADKPEKVKELRARYDAFAKAAATPGNQTQGARFQVPKSVGRKGLTL